MSGPKADLSTYAAGMLQSKAYRALQEFMNHHLQASDLSVSEWKVLGLAYEDEQLTPSLISKNLSVKLPIATRIIKSLESKRLVKRTMDSADNRVVRVQISREGKDLAAKLEKKLRQEMKVFLQDVNRNDLLIYVKVLSQIASKLR